MIAVVFHTVIFQGHSGYEDPDPRNRWPIPIEEDKGKTPLSLGIRNDSVDLKIKFKAKKGKEKITIKFPG